MLVEALNVCHFFKHLFFLFILNCVCFRSSWNFLLRFCSTKSNDFLYRSVSLCIEEEGIEEEEDCLNGIDTTLHSKEESATKFKSRKYIGISSFHRCRFTFKWLNQFVFIPAPPSLCVQKMKILFAKQKLN